MMTFNNSQYNFESNANIFMQAKNVHWPRKWINKSLCYKNNIKKYYYHVKCKMWNVTKVELFAGDIYKLRIIVNIGKKNRIIPLKKYYSAFHCFPNHDMNISVDSVSYTGANISWTTNWWDEKFVYIDKTAVKVKGNIYQNNELPFQQCDKGCAYKIFGLKSCSYYNICIINTFAIYQAKDVDSCKQIKTLCKIITIPDGAPHENLIIGTIVFGVLAILIIIVIIYLIKKNTKDRNNNDLIIPIKSEIANEYLIAENKNENIIGYLNGTRLPLYISEEGYDHIDIARQEHE